RSLELLGMTAAELGDHTRAERLLQQAIEAGREASDPATLAVMTANLGELEMRCSAFDRAIELMEEAIATTRRLGRADLTAWALINLALCRLRIGRDEDSVTAATESLSLARSIGDVETLSPRFIFVGAVAARRGDFDRAAKLLGVAQALNQR